MSYKTGGMFSGNNSGVYLCCFCSSLHITTHMLNLLLIWPCLCGHHKSLPEAFWIAGIKWTAEQVETHEENLIFWAPALHQEHMYNHFSIRLNPGSFFIPITWQFPCVLQAPVIFLHMDASAISVIWSVSDSASESFPTFTRISTIQAEFYCR